MIGLTGQGVSLYPADVSVPGEAESESEGLFGSDVSLPNTAVSLVFVFVPPLPTGPPQLNFSANTGSMYISVLGGFG